MYINDDSTTIRALMSKLEDLQKYNDQIELGKDAKRRKIPLLAEINKLWAELRNEEG